MEIAVRPATEADLSSLLALYAELNPEDRPLSPEAALGVWRDITSQDGRSVLVAVPDGAVAGTLDCVVLSNLTRDGRPFMVVENVVVAAAHRRRGVGSSLMERAVGIARSTACYKLQLLSAQDDDAHGFYVSCGFRPLAQGFRLYLD